MLILSIQPQNGFCIEENHGKSYETGRVGYVPPQETSCCCIRGIGHFTELGQTGGGWYQSYAGPPLGKQAK